MKKGEIWKYSRDWETVILIHFFLFHSPFFLFHCLGHVPPTTFLPPLERHVF